MALLHMAPDIKVASSRLETPHASFRPLFITHGVQTHAAYLESIFAKRICQRGRKRAEFSHMADAVGAGASCATNANAPETIAGDDNPAVNKENPWNLYMYRRALGHDGVAGWQFP